MLTLDKQDVTRQCSVAKLVRTGGLGVASKAAAPEPIEARRRFKSIRFCVFS